VGAGALNRRTPQEELLDDLLARITPENVHDEIDTGPSVGGEAWGTDFDLVVEINPTIPHDAPPGSARRSDCRRARAASAAPHERNDDRVT
jgi:hypothetical protein